MASSPASQPSASPAVSSSSNKTGLVAAVIAVIVVVILIVLAYCLYRRRYRKQASNQSPGAYNNPLLDTSTRSHGKPNHESKQPTETKPETHANVVIDASAVSKISKPADAGKHGAAVKVEDQHMVDEGDLELGSVDSHSSPVPASLHHRVNNIHLEQKYKVTKESHAAAKTETKVDSSTQTSHTSVFEHQVSVNNAIALAETFGPGYGTSLNKRENGKLPLTNTSLSPTPHKQDGVASEYLYDDDDDDSVEQASFNAAYMLAETFAPDYEPQQSKRKNKKLPPQPGNPVPTGPAGPKFTAQVGPPPALPLPPALVSAAIKAKHNPADDVRASIPVKAVAATFDGHAPESAFSTSHPDERSQNKVDVVSSVPVKFVAASFDNWSPEAPIYSSTAGDITSSIPVKSVAAAYAHQADHLSPSESLAAGEVHSLVPVKVVAAQFESDQVSQVSVTHPILAQQLASAGISQSQAQQLAFVGISQDQAQLLLDHDAHVSFPSSVPAFAHAKGPPVAPPPPPAPPVAPVPGPSPTKGPPPPPPLPKGPPPPPPPGSKGPSSKAPAPPPPPPGGKGPPPPPPPGGKGPPPPPPPGGKGPPPPPPPGGKGPPPPPGPKPPPGSRPPLPGKPPQAPQQDSSQKLKPLHWDKVRADPSHSMVWDKLRTGSFELNEDEISALFGTNLAAKKEVQKVAAAPKKKSILDSKKAQNIAIQLRALNVSTQDICDALLEGDGLKADLLEILVKMSPTQEEQKALLEYSGDKSELGPAERFLKTVLEIPNAFQRLQAMQFKVCFKDDLVQIQEVLQVLEAACVQVKENRLFLKLLEAVLKTGNRMNKGTNRGEAEAFKLDTLLKLSDIKSADGKKTLLHFVADEIIKSEGHKAVRANNEAGSSSGNKSAQEQKNEDDIKRMGLQIVMELCSGLESVKKAADVDADALNQSVLKLSNGFQSIQHRLKTSFQVKAESSSGIFPTEDTFAANLEIFCSQAASDVEKLKEDLANVFDKVSHVTKYFHGNLRESQPLRLFVIVRDFLIILEKVCKDLGKPLKFNFRG